MRFGAGSALPIALAAAIAAASPAHAVDGGQNGKIAYVHQGDIYVVNADGSDRVRLTSTPDYERGPSWSPDGQQIAFVRPCCSYTGDLLVMNADGTGERRVGFNASLNDQPTWSPDGKKIAFTTYFGDQTDIAVAESATEVVATRLTFGGKSQEPDWGANGRIAFTRWVTGGSEIWSMRADGGDQRFEVRASSTRLRHPEWHGAELAFASDLERAYGNLEIYYQGRRLTYNWDSDDFPVVSPDGRQVAYVRHAGVNYYQLHVVDSDGSEDRVVNHDDVLPVGGIDWQPVFPASPGPRGDVREPVWP